MEFDNLKYFLRWSMRLGSGHHIHQPMVIKLLIENNGKITKEKIQKEIFSASSSIVNTPDNHYVYRTLETNNIIKNNTNNVSLLHYEDLNDEQKKILLNICKHRIQKDVLTEDHILSLRTEFFYWVKHDSSINYFTYFKDNKNIIMDMLKNFDNDVYDDDEYRDIHSILFPLNIKNTLDYHIIPDFEKISLVLLKNFRDNSDIKQFIDKYVEFKFNNIDEMPKIITQILFYMENSCPIIDKHTNSLYEKLIGIFKISKNLSLNMQDYVNNIECWNKLLSKIKNDDIENIRDIQIFCYWLDKFIFHNPKTSSNDWNALNITNYLSFKPDIDEHDLKRTTGIVILLDALGTKSKSNEPPRNWLKLVRNWKKYFDSYEEYSSKSTPVKFSYFSDTIMITIEVLESVDLTEKINNIGTALGKFIIRAIDLKIFFRGCIGYGEYYSSTVGSMGGAVNEAGSYYELPNWIGVSTTPNLYAKLMDKYPKNKVDYPFIHYTLPTKNGLEPNFVLNLQHIWDLESRSGRLCDVLKKQIRGETTLDQNASLKYRNTIKFIDDVAV